MQSVCFVTKSCSGVELCFSKNAYIMTQHRQRLIILYLRQSAFGKTSEFRKLLAKRHDVALSQTHCCVSVLPLRCVNISENVTHFFLTGTNISVTLLMRSVIARITAVRVTQVQPYMSYESKPGTHKELNVCE